MTSPLLPGSFLDEKYRVERVLGQGGMGIVIAATHLQLQQQVAIKMLLPEIAGDKKLVARFLQEGRSQVRIQGEHVVRVLDVGTLADGAPYMVMELLAGNDLATVAETRGALPVHEAIDYVLQATEALAQAHSLGIVHRDLKPQNMFLTSRPDGSPLVKVLDFGISKNELLSDATRRAANTTEGGLLGSPAYMCPEQIRNPKDATARSDIWSLGVILYELLTARMPFEAMSLGGLLAAITRDPPVDIRRYRSDLPDQIANVVMRCLALNPDDRPQDAAELALALALDAAGHARASRIAQIVRRFSIQPAALAKTVLAGDVTMLPGDITMFGDANAMIAVDATAMAASGYAPVHAPYSAQAQVPYPAHVQVPGAQAAGPDSSSTFEGSSTELRVDLPMSRMSTRKVMAIAASVVAVAMGLVVTNIAVARTGTPKGEAAAGMAAVAPPPVTTVVVAAAPLSGSGTGTGTSESGAPGVNAAASAPSAAATAAPSASAKARGRKGDKPRAAAAVVSHEAVTTPEPVRDVLDTRK